MSSGHHEEECSQIDLFRLGTKSPSADHWCICPIMRAQFLFPVGLDYMSSLLVTSRSQEEQEECSLAITGHLSLRS
jgi:hypothetical protein